MNSPLLEKISQPSDLKKLSSQQTVQLCLMWAISAIPTSC